MFTSKDISFLQTLGEGTFGRVVLVQLKEEVTTDYVFLACKITKKQFLLEKRNAENTKREINVLNQLYGHPFFPKLYSVFEFHDRLCFLMDFCEGGELFRWIRKTGGLSYELVRFYGAEVLLGLKKLRSLNILYRDLKSENVLLTADGHLKLVDFGFSVRTTTKAWMTVGTAECMAPEVISSQGYGPEADLWSFGILLYEMVHCKTPFGAENIDDNTIKERVVNEEPSFAKGLDKDYVNLISGLLQKNPLLRLGYKDIEDVMKHPFFREVDWTSMEMLKVAPPVSPEISYEGDATNFDFYRESITSFDFPPMSILRKKNPDLMYLFN